MLYTSHFHIIKLMLYTVLTFMITMLDVQLQMAWCYILGRPEQNEPMFVVL